MSEMRERLAKWASLNDLVEREVCARDFELADDLLAELDAAEYAVVPKIPPLKEAMQVCDKHGIDSSLSFLDAWQELIAITKEAGDER